MSEHSHQRAYKLGLTGGSLWLISAGTASAIWALLTIQTVAATTAAAGFGAVAAALIVSGIGLIRKARREPMDTSSELSVRRKMMRRFVIIVAAEIIAWLVVNMVCLLVLHRSRYIVPLDILIVGIHFLPLARLFQVPRYYAMGVLFCVIPVATMLAVQYSAHVGHGVIWKVVPSVGCGLVAMATGMAGLNEVRKSLQGVVRT
jgi:hypothetical protein